MPSSSIISASYTRDVLSEIVKALGRISPEMKTKILQQCEREYNKRESDGLHFEAGVFKRAYEELLNQGTCDYFRMILLAKRFPPSIDELLESKEFLGNSLNVWPALREQIRKYNPHIMSGESAPTLVIDNSTLGTGKSFSSIISLIYTLVTLHCFEHPLLLFKNIDPNFPIFLYIVSAKPNVTSSQLYTPLRDLVDSMPFFRDINYSRDKKSSLEFSNKIILNQASSTNPTQFLSLAVIRSLFDEANFCEYVDNSKRAGYGERIYDEAQQLFETLQSRYTSRFAGNGFKFGGIQVSSSPLHEQDFISRLKEMLDNGTYTVPYAYIQNRKWDVAPEGTYDKWFYYTPQTAKEDSKIYPDDPDNVPPHAIRIPEALKPDFEVNPTRAQRDHLGLKTSALNPFIKEAYIIGQAVRVNDKGCTTRLDYNLAANQGYPQLVPEKVINPGLPRFLHVDLSLVGDRAGIAMVHIDSTMFVNGQPVPHIYVDFAISITPNAKNRLKIHEVREFIESIRFQYGINLVHVSFDQFQSEETRTILHDKGIPTSLTSVDRAETNAYVDFRTLLEGRRISMPDNPLLIEELRTLEEQILPGDKIKIDHQPKGSKDVSDAVCGAVFNIMKSGTSFAMLAHQHMGQLLKDQEEYEEFDPDDYGGDLY